MTGGGNRIESLIVPEPGCRSAEAALKLAEIADVHAQLRAAIAGLPVASFAWQPSHGCNTIGMLLAHIALAEVNLGQVILRGEPAGHVADVLGIGVDDDGMPVESFGGTPPAALAGRDEAFFLDLLARAQAHTRDACRTLDEGLLGAEIVRPPRRDGGVRVFSRRWTLHHLVEHAAQHLGQILVLRRQVPRL